MIKALPFDINDLSLFEWRFQDRVDGDWREVAKNTFGSNVLAVTIYDEHEVIGVVGVTIIYNKVGEVFTFFSESVRKHPISIVKILNKLIRSCAETLGLKRLQMTCLADEMCLNKFAKVLGFNKECVLHKYGRDLKDYAMYVRFYD